MFRRNWPDDYCQDDTAAARLVDAATALYTHTSLEHGEAAPFTVSEAECRPLRPNRASPHRTNHHGQNIQEIASE